MSQGGSGGWDEQETAIRRDSGVSTKEPTGRGEAGRCAKQAGHEAHVYHDFPPSFPAVDAGFCGATPPAPVAPAQEARCCRSCEIWIGGEPDCCAPGCACHARPTPSPGAPTPEPQRTAEPRGCPTPGACSCLAAPPSQREAELQILLRRVVKVLPRPWMDGGVTWKEWEETLAAIDEALGEAPGE